MTFIVFPTQEEAIAADLQVACNFNMCGGTTRYQQEIESADGRWFFPAPPQVVLRHPAVANEFGGTTEVTETRDALFGVSGFEAVESIEPKPAAEPPIAAEPAPNPA